MCLNFCSRKWLSLTRNLVNSLIPWWLYTLTVLLGLGLINLRIFFLKALTDSEFWILLLSLFHSITVDGKKKEFRKYSCLTLNKGMLLWFVVVRVDRTLGIISKRQEGCKFFLSLKNKHNFRYHCRDFSDSRPDKASLLRNLW